MFGQLLFALGAASTVLAQRPSDTPVCDYYTTALLKENTAANQLTLLTLLVNTVVIGNYTMPNVGVKVPGILASGTYNGTAVNLLPYFDGTLASTNRGGSAGVSVNFLDGGGAAPLMKNMPAENQTSKQYFLLTHLYQFFGALLGCTQYGMGVFSAYGGDPSMYKVHKFMALDEAEVGYFITQIALAAASFGVAQDDIMSIGTTLGNVFGVRCAPEITLTPALGPQLQAICIADTCPLSPNATCAAYEAVVEPKNATASGSGSATGGTATRTGSPTMTSMPVATVSRPSSAGRAEVGLVALALGVFAALMV